MRNRTKFDPSKPFRFIDNKKAFDELDANDENLLIAINAEDQDASPQPVKKEDIPVPKIDTVDRATPIKTFARITPNYVRLPSHLTFPLANHYELTEVDHVFLNNNSRRFLIRGRKILTEEFMRKVIMELEIKAGKDMTLPRGKGWLLAFLERECKEALEMEGVDAFAETVYNYWKNRREELKFPLLRLLWKPNPDEYNHMLAFRPRDREKRNLRRTNRIVEDELIEQLFEEFSLAAKIVDRVQNREELKLKHVQLQLSAFYSDCRSFINQPDFLGELKLEKRGKDKQKMKRHHTEIQEFKAQKASFQITFPTEAESEVDQKLSVTTFLATMVHEAEKLGITYQKLYYSNNSLVQKNKSASNSADLFSAPPPISLEKPQQQQSPDSIISVSLFKHKDFIIRHLERQESPQPHLMPCRDFLDFKARSVGQYYYGSDDEWEAKDLKKNISASFKKFMQLQQLTRTLSIHSEI